MTPIERTRYRTVIRQAPAKEHRHGPYGGVEVDGWATLRTSKSYRRMRRAGIPAWEARLILHRALFDGLHAAYSPNGRAVAS